MRQLLQSRIETLGGQTGTPIEGSTFLPRESTRLFVAAKRIDVTTVFAKTYSHLQVNVFLQVTIKVTTRLAETHANCIVVNGLSLMNADTTDTWQPGFNGVDDPERLRRFEADVATAEIDIRISSKDEIDIGIAGHSFTLSELKRCFRFQRHKEFIVVTYDNNSPHGNLKDSLKELKEYFGEAGYKRILLTHSHSSGVIIREDYRPQKPRKMP